LLVDATHAIPFVPVQPWIGEIDYLVCHGYKHLLCPRGVGFLHLRRERWQRVPPWFANWRTSATLYDHSYGGSLRHLAANARRFDISLAWHAWVGAEPALALLIAWQADGALDQVRALARRLAAGVGRPAPSASIVSLRVADAVGAERALAETGVRCAARKGNLRLSPHVYNTEDDIDRAIAALRGYVV
jgi:selenocysteine lyase/cysteine desulfurase